MGTLPRSLIKWEIMSGDLWGHYTFCSAGAGSSQVVIMQTARRHY